MQDGNMAWTVVDPSAFFKDMVNILRLVKKGSFTGLGKLLDHKANPIHVQDLAARVVDTITRKEDRNTRVAVSAPSHQYSDVHTCMVLSSWKLSTSCLHSKES